MNLPNLKILPFLVVNTGFFPIGPPSEKSSADALADMALTITLMSSDPARNYFFLPFEAHPSYSRLLTTIFFVLLNCNKILYFSFLPRTAGNIFEFIFFVLNVLDAVRDPTDIQYKEMLHTVQNFLFIPKTKEGNEQVVRGSKGL